MRVTSIAELQAAIDAGNEREITLAPGRYTPVRVRGQTIRAEERWRSVFVPDPALSDRHNVYGDPGSKIIGVVSWGSMIDGIKVEHECEVRDCWVSHAKRQGISSHSEPEQGETVIERNLVEFCGHHPQYDHGIYASGKELVIARNVIRHCSGRGLHLYPHISESLIHHNLLVHQACGKAAIFHSRGENLIAHNTLVDRGRTLYLDAGEGDVVANNLLCGELEMPVSPDNLHCTVEEARFVDAPQEIFWLREDSPAVRDGVPLESITEDFWGEPIGPAMYRGCFAYRDDMTRESFRRSWVAGWPYQYKEHGAVPDPLSGGQAGVIDTGGPA